MTQRPQINMMKFNNMFKTPKIYPMVTHNQKLSPKIESKQINNINIKKTIKTSFSMIDKIKNAKPGCSSCGK